MKKQEAERKKKEDEENKKRKEEEAKKKQEEEAKKKSQEEQKKGQDPKPNSKPGPKHNSNQNNKKDPKKKGKPGDDFEDLGKEIEKDLANTLTRGTMQPGAVNNKLAKDVAKSVPGKPLAVDDSTAKEKQKTKEAIDKLEKEMFDNPFEEK